MDDFGKYPRGPNGLAAYPSVEVCRDLECQGADDYLGSVAADTVV